MSVGPYRFTQSPKGQLKGNELKSIEFSAVTADKSIDDLWTLTADEDSTDSADEVEITLTRVLNEKVARRWREHTLTIVVAPKVNFWHMTKSTSSADLLEKAGSYLQQEWATLLSAFEKNATRFVMGCTSYGVSQDEIRKSKGQQVSYVKSSNELLFQIQVNGSGPWLKLSPELYDLVFAKLKISKIEEIAARLKFRDYQTFGVLERYFGEFGRKVDRTPKFESGKLPTLEEGGWLPVAGTSFQISSFDEIRCRHGLAVGDNLETLVELQIDPDNFQSKSGYAVRILKQGFTLGYIRDDYAEDLFKYLETIGGVARCKANLYFSPVPAGIPQVNGEGGIPGNAIQLDLKIPQNNWLEDYFEESSDDSDRPQFMQFE
jgi:hypothetical protein